MTPSEDSLGREVAGFKIALKRTLKKLSRAAGIDPKQTPGYQWYKAIYMIECQLDFAREFCSEGLSLGDQAIFLEAGLRESLVAFMIAGILGANLPFIV